MINRTSPNPRDTANYPIMVIIHSFIIQDLIYEGLDRIFDRLVPVTTPYRREIYVLYMVVAVLLLLSVACVVPIAILLLLG